MEKVITRHSRGFLGILVAAGCLLALGAGSEVRAADADPQVPYALAAAGDSLFALNKIDQAEAEYQKSYEAAKSFQAGTAPREEGLCLANYGLARVALVRGETKDAGKLLKSCKDKPQYEGIYMLGMGLTAYKEGNLDESERLLLQGASRLDLARGDSPADEVRLEMADSLVSIALAKDLPLIAVERLNERAKLVPGDPAPHVRRGRILEDSKQYEEAVEAYGQAIAVDSTAVEAYRGIAGIYSRAQGGKPVAAKTLERLAIAQPTAENWAAAGEAWMEAGQPQSAAPLFEKAVAAGGPAKAQVGLARAIYASGDREKAVTIFQGIDPSALSADDWDAIGKALLEQKDYPQARNAFLKESELDPTRADALFYAGYTHYVSREYAEAIPYFERRIAIDSKSTAAFSNLGLCYLQVGKPEEGIAMLQKAVDLDPDDSRSRIWLAQAYAVQSKWGESAAEYEKVIAMDAESAEAWRGLGFAQLNQNRYGEAIDSLTKADQLEPNNVQGLVWLAQGHGMVEHYDTAASLFRKALSVDPSSQEARQGLQMIDEVTKKQKKRRPSAS